MKLLKITDQIRRDFWGTYECEGCGNIEENVSGYDDDHFHKIVIPNRKCKKCGKSTNDLGLIAEKIQTKYNSKVRETYYDTP